MIGTERQPHCQLVALPGNPAIDHDFSDAIWMGLREGTAGRQPHAHHLDVVRPYADQVDEQLSRPASPVLPGAPGIVTID